MKSRLLLSLFLLLPATCLAADDLFDIKPIADGVYAAIAKPAYKVNCNAAIIVLGDSVLVVDTHSKPSAARALIEQIKKLTPKPVKFVVNTHFHWDHYQGNEAYPSSWPAGVEIISSEATRQNIQRLGIPRIKNEIVTMPQEIANLKTALEKAPTADQKAAIQENLRQAEAYFGELKLMQITLPTMTFDRSLILRRGSRTVEILWLGRAHTDGDVFVFLPNEKVPFCPRRPRRRNARQTKIRTLETIFSGPDGPHRRRLRRRRLPRPSPKNRLRLPHKKIRRPIRPQLPQIRNRQRNQGLPSNRLPPLASRPATLLRRSGL